MKRAWWSTKRAGALKQEWLVSWSHGQWVCASLSGWFVDVPKILQANKSRMVVRGKVRVRFRIRVSV